MEDEMSDDDSNSESDVDSGEENSDSLLSMYTF